MRQQSFWWRAIVPRLLMLVIFLAGLQHLLGHAARRVADRCVEAAVAAKVEVATARVSVFERQVVLDGLRMASPRDPGANLLQAASCELDFAVAPMLYRQAVIERGRIIGLQIDGQLSQAGREPGEHANGRADNWLTEGADEAARRWLAELSERFAAPAESQFESLERSEAVGAHWSRELAALQKRGEALRRRATDLQQGIDSAEANRLRHAEFFQALPGRVAALRKSSDEYGAELDKLSVSLDSEGRDVVAARQRDERRYREQLGLKPIDVDSLSAYLLREQMAGPLDTLIGLLRWSRQVVTARPAATIRQARGEDLLFAGGRAAPNFLIRMLQIQGEARLDGQSIELAGQLTDVTNAPSRHNAPICLRMTGAGSLPLDLQATIDRTGDVAQDKLVVECGSMALPAFRLGSSGELEIGVGPSRGTLSIRVAVEGEELRGEIQLAQKAVQLTPVLHGQLNGVELNSPLAAALGKLDSTTTQLSLRGTLSKPSCTIASTLGRAVAGGMAKVVRDASEQHAQRVFADVRQQVDERLANVERQLAEERAKLVAELAGAVDQLELVAQRQAPRERLSSEQIGRRLPANSLLR